MKRLAKAALLAAIAFIGLTGREAPGRSLPISDQLICSVFSISGSEIRDRSGRQQPIHLGLLRHPQQEIDYLGVCVVGSDPHVYRELRNLDLERKGSSDRRQWTGGIRWSANH